MSLAAIALAYVAAAAAYASLSRRMPPRVVRMRPLCAAIAIAAVIGAVAVWPPHDGRALAGVSVALSVSAMATLVILLAPLAPRVVWIAALLAPIVAGVAAAIG